MHEANHVHCRVGSLEKHPAVRRICAEVHCRVGSLETSQQYKYQGSLIYVAGDIDFVLVAKFPRIKWAKFV